jgi:hypothetical protein
MKPVLEEEFDEGAKTSKFPIKYIVPLAIVIVVIIIGLSLLTPQEMPSNISISTADQNFGYAGSITTNGDLAASFGSDGDTYKAPINSGGGRIIVNTHGLSKSTLSGNTTITLRNGNGITIGTIPASSIEITDNGDIIIDLDTADIDFNFDSGDLTDTTLIIVIDNGDTGEVLTIEVPIEIQFQEFLGTGCLQLTTKSVTQTAHNGFLELIGKINNTCNDDDLSAQVSWTSDYYGPIEMYINRKGYTLTPNPQEILGNFGSIQDFKIIFMPNKSAHGERAKFSVDFALQNSEESILFDVAAENLEQCLVVKATDPEINDWDDTAKITLDASKCNSERIAVFLCDSDYGCSGGAEGGISLSEGYFNLTKYEPIRTINIYRDKIPGVYGVTVHARVTGMEKTFIDEKEIFVKPTDETIVPDKFVVSLVGSGVKDTVRVKNTKLAQNVSIKTGICNLYDSSFGIKNGEMPITGAFLNSGDWLNDLATNQDYYAGIGFYQTALANSLSSISQARMSAYSISSQENFKIKEAYTYTIATKNDIESFSDASNGMVGAADDLSDALGDQTDYAAEELTEQMSGLVSSLTSIESNAISLCSQISSVASTANSLKSTVCGPAISGVNAASGSLETAKEQQCGGLLTALPQMIITANNLYSLYNQLDTMTQDAEEIDAKASLNKAKEANKKIPTIVEKLSNAIDYVELALEAASLDSFESASDDDMDAREYLVLAQKEVAEVSILIEDTRDVLVLADDSLTILQEEEPDTTELVIMITSTLITLTDMIYEQDATADGVVKSLKKAQTSAGDALSLAQASANGCSVTCTECCKCRASVPSITGLNSSIGSAIGKATGQKSDLVKYNDNLSMILTALDTYETLTTDYVDELTTARTIYNNTLSAMDNLLLSNASANTYLEAAIPAALRLANLEEIPSRASNYVDTLNLGGNYNRERIVGLIASLITNGFVNGAYAGGVYTNAPTQLLATPVGDCSKKVELKLPAFTTNLLQDAKPVNISNNNIIAMWNFGNAKMFDVYEEQDVGLLFANSGLKENSYATIELPFVERTYDTTVEPTGEFGPFNIAPKAKLDKSYKYHFKFNVKPRSAAAPVFDATCSKGIMFGGVGKEALPQVILNWDWNGINSEIAEEKYLDATQFSILLSKKLKILNRFLDYSTPSCPTSPTLLAVKALVPDEISVDETEGCFLPLTTRHYDGKPALYYFLDNSSSVPTNISTNFFEEEELISTADEMLDALDFDVYLMKDGYGTDFQQDFVQTYTKTLFKASPDFLDPDEGMNRYFKRNDKFYFSSEANSFKKEQNFVLPDAGKYHVRLLIDLYDTPLISQGQLHAEIIVSLQLSEAVNSNYSPFYYMPFDGITGARSENNRLYYGSNPAGSVINVGTNVIFSGQQNKALVEIDFVEEEDFFRLNSLNSKRSRLLDYYFDGDAVFTFSPTLATPLLMQITNINETPQIEYTVMKDDRRLDAESSNLFLVNSLFGCNDFLGDELTFINNIPDLQFGEAYGLVFPNGPEKGSVYLTTTAYTPTDESYGLDFSGGTIETANTLEEEFLIFEGIKGMHYNDLIQGNKIEALSQLFTAVEEESVCVSRLGNREIYWWPEEYLFEYVSNDGFSLQQKINEAKKNCIQ